MTEDEAKRRWCPFVRVMVARMDKDENPTCAASVNRSLTFSVEKSNPYLCIASKCMAWRWGNNGRAQWRVTRENGSEEIWNWDPREDPEVWGKHISNVREVTNEDRDGFCGLAGEP